MLEIFAAYVRDRAAQYDESSGIFCALSELAFKIESGEPMVAYRHGELDDLLNGVHGGEDENSLD
jgi:hypothetical protein